MKTIQEFREYYGRDLAADIAQLDARRKKVLAYLAALTIMAASAVLFSLFIISSKAVISEYSIYMALAFLPPFAAVTLWVLGYLFLTRRYTRDFRVDVVVKVVKFIDEGLDYSKDRYVAESSFRDSKIFEQAPDRYSGQDCVFGTVGETMIEFSKVNAEYKTEIKEPRDRTRTEWHTIFSGIFFVADFNKDFKGLTLVLPDTAERLFGGVMGRFLQSHTPGRPQLVKLEDPEFEKYFVVYGEDQIEARYILSPSLMERLTEFRKRTGKKVCFSFVNDKVMAAIPYDGDLFEPRLYRTIKDPKWVEDHFENLELITGIVDELSLNTRIWGKSQSFNP